MILAVRDAIGVAVLRMAKVVAGMRVAHAIAKRVAGGVLLQLREGEAGMVIERVANKPI